jgi:hypothetical protein
MFFSNIQEATSETHIGGLYASQNQISLWVPPINCIVQNIPETCFWA